MIIGCVLIVAGLLAAASQVFVVHPWQALFAAGVLVALAGAFRVCDLQCNREELDVRSRQ